MRTSSSFLDTTISAGYWGNPREKVFWNMFHMGLNSCRVERFIVSEILKIQRVIFEVGLEALNMKLSNDV